MYRSLRSDDLFVAQLALLPNPQSPKLYNDCELARHPKVPLSMAASTSHVIHVPHPKLHFYRFSRFLHSSRQSPYT